MIFWVFILICDLALPVTLIVFGKLYTKGEPRDMSALYGFRTKMSMLNRETWIFAHVYCGKLWLKLGWLVLGGTMVLMISIYGERNVKIGILGSIIFVLQILLCAFTVILTEKALRRTFDKDGERIKEI